MGKVLILGASGLLGHHLVPWLQGLGYAVVRAGRNPADNRVLDVLDRPAMTALLQKVAPRYVVNLIGATNVDLCETDISYAYNANVAVAANLAAAVAACPELAVHLVHVSTDQVYDGPGLHVEECIAPLNVYALSKYAGERALTGSPVAILRTNFFGKSRAPSRPSFTDWLVCALQGEAEFTLFSDVVFNAVHMDTLCDVIHRVMIQRVVGVYNVGSRGAISKAEFGLRLAAALQLPSGHARQGSSSDVLLKAKRPCNMSMDVTRLESALTFQCPSIEDEIARAAREYSHV
jgi:dTDP-4-dehydrorhamnose reductase